MAEKTLKDFSKRACERWTSLPTKGKVGLLAAVITLALIAGGITVAIDQSRNAQLNEIFAQASSVDKVIVDVDKVLTVGLSETSPAQITTAEHELNVAQRQIQSAITSAEKLKKKAAKKDQHRIELVQNSLGVRAYILSVAPELLLDNKQAAIALNEADKAWKSLTDGVQTSQDARDLQKSGKPADLKQSNKLYQQSTKSYEAAKTALQKAGTAFPDANFGAYFEYLDQCIKLNGYAQDANKNLLKKQKKQAQEAIKKYNEMSKSAAIFANENLKSLNSVIMAAYKVKTEALSNQYFSAREKVSIIDRQIR